MDWLQASEVVAGRVLAGQIKPSTVEAARLAPPYDEIVRALRAKKDETYLTDTFGVAAIFAARRAAEAVQTSEADWLKILDLAGVRYEVGLELEKAAHILKGGEAMEPVQLYRAVSRLERETYVVTPASQIKPEIQHFKPIFWRPVDEEIGGVPLSGLVLIAALPKIGKTTLLLRLALNAAVYEKTSLIFSLEQRKDEVVGRLLEIGGKLKKKTLSYIRIVDEMLDIDQIAALVARERTDHDLYFVGADFTDLIAHRPVDEATTTHVYRVSAEIAKVNQTPFMLLSQFNTEGFRSGIPQVDHIRYSRMAVGYASQIWLLHNPARVMSSVKEDARLPLYPGQSYVIFGVSRHGFGEHKDVGAVRVGWDPKNGWGQEPLGWHPLTASGDY